MAGVIPIGANGPNPWAEAIRQKQPSAIQTVIQNQQYHNGLKNALQKQELVNSGALDQQRIIELKHLAGQLGPSNVVSGFNSQPVNNNEYVNNLETQMIDAQKYIPAAANAAINTQLAESASDFTPEARAKLNPELSGPDQNILLDKEYAGANTTNHITTTNDAKDKYYMQETLPDGTKGVVEKHVGSKEAVKSNGAAQGRPGVTDNLRNPSNVNGVNINAERLQAIEFVENKRAQGIPGAEAVGFDPAQGTVTITFTNADGKLEEQVHRYRQ